MHKAVLDRRVRRKSTQGARRAGPNVRPAVSLASPRERGGNNSAAAKHDRGRRSKLLSPRRYGRQFPGNDRKTIKATLKTRQIEVHHRRSVEREHLAEGQAPHDGKSERLAD